MTNYVSELSEEEKDQLRLEKRRTSLQGQVDDLIFSALDKRYGGLGEARTVNEEDPNWSQLQKARSDANQRLQGGADVRTLANPAGVPEPHLMQDHKLMEQVNREARIKIGNYWSQIAENFALGKGPVYEPIGNFPTTPQAPTLPNVNMDFSGQPTPQAPQAPIRTAEEVDARQAARDAAQEPVPGLLKQLFVETPLQIDRSANQFASGNRQGFKPVGSGFSYSPDTPVPASRTGSENIGGDIATGLTPLIAHSQRVGGMQAPQEPDQSAEFNPFSGKFDVNPEQFLTAEEAQAKAEKEKYAGMTYDQMQMAKAMERTQLEDNAQAASTESTAAPTQPSSFATSQGAATTVGGQDLGEYLRGGQAPVEGQQTPSMTPQAPVAQGQAPVSKFEQESANREARIEQNFGNGRAVSDRERRGTGEMSMEAAVRMAGGDRVRAREMIELQRQGRDPITGAAPKAAESQSLGLKEKAEIGKIEAETAKILDGINKTNDTTSWGAGQTEAMKTQARELADWEINQLPKLENNLSSLKEVSRELSGGQIKTGGLLDQLPGSNWARPWMNPDAEVAKQQVSGVIMQTLKETFPGAISNEERTALISTVYNPQLSPEKNAELVSGYADRLDRAMKAKKSQMAHFRIYGNLENYTGQTPRDAIMEGISVGPGSSGSPIEGDVDIQSESDQYYKD